MCLWSSLIGIWVWFPDIYAATVCDVSDADTDVVKYDEATKEAAMVMITFPISAMVLGLCFTTFNLFNRISKKLIFQLFNVLMALMYVAILFIPSKGLFMAVGVLCGFSTILINSGQFLLIDAYRSGDDYPKNRGLGSDNSVCTISGVFKFSYVFFLHISLVTRLAWPTGGLVNHQRFNWPAWIDHQCRRLPWICLFMSQLYHLPVWATLRIK